MIGLQDALGEFNKGIPGWYGWINLEDGEVYSNLKLNDETAVMPTEEEVNAKIAELQWLENRISEYPSVQDCIHALLDGGDTLTDLQAQRQAVKDKYPKG
jgi:predicted DNA-binding transcriptional regulator YafY